MTEQSELKMKFDPMVIEHLGVRMYSTLPPVLSELIANSYDADAKNVRVKLYDKGEKKIVVEDDGIGMSLEDILNKFLVIGRNRRKDEKNKPTQGGRKPIGKKGLGKISFFGIVKTITVNTVKDNKRNIFVMDWDKLMSSDGEYMVDHTVRDESVESEAGTEIVLTNIDRSSNFSETNIAKSLAKFFIFDKDFNVTITRNAGNSVPVTNELRIESLNPQFKWSIPEDMRETAQYAYLKKHKITGDIITSEKPIPPKNNARGVALFSRQKLVQEHTEFAESTSSVFFAYLSGRLKIDFIDDLPEDVIATNRQSLNWGNRLLEDLEENLRECISHIQKDWRKKRKEHNKKQLATQFSAEWFDSMPKKMRQEVKKLVAKIETLSSVTDADLATMSDILHEIIPLYPIYHWRHLHKNLMNPLQKYYQKKEYFQAASEGVKIYESDVQNKSQVMDRDGVDLFQHVFAEKTKILKIHVPVDGQKTHTNVQEGQQFLSVGLMKSFRNPAFHHPERDIGTSKFFTEDDCLDILSLISFLLRRVENADVNIQKEKSKNKKP